MPSDHKVDFSTPSPVRVTGPNNTLEHGDSYQPYESRTPPSDLPSSSSTALSDHPSKRPLLPPRPSTNITVIDGKTFQPSAHPTTAISSVDIQTLSFPDGSRGTFPTPALQDFALSTPVTSLRSRPTTPGRPFSADGSPHESASATSAVSGDDAASITSFAGTTRPLGDIASLLAGDLNRKSAAWNLLRAQSATVQPFENVKLVDISTDLAGLFEQEFDPLPPEGSEGCQDDSRLQLWKAKLKHYMIVSSAGKPIYSRHGDLALINSSMGVIQTIISFYEGVKDKLLGFTAGNTRFVVTTQGPLYLVAISKLGESDAQLRAQLDALYMQILSTLTLPTLTKIFAHRPSSDLRKPLEGTEPLLSSLADNFTRGSASTLLGALECLKLRKSQRHAINNAFLKLRSENLLYGLIVAGGRLVSVIRPRRHSLHPSDLQLIFNMLFESGGIKAGGGENWIPLCLPSFNSGGYLYMYVSFLDGVNDVKTTVTEPLEDESKATRSYQDEIAMILISANKESFFELQQMRDAVSGQLARTGHLAIVSAAARVGRPSTQDIAPGSQVSHFLYKSRANVQFCSSSFEPAFATPLARRRLMTLYHGLHAAIHSKHSHLKVLHSVSSSSTSLAWVTPVFELYCVAGPNVSRATLTQGANKITQWAKCEEERLFIIGGGVW